MLAPFFILLGFAVGMTVGSHVTPQCTATVKTNCYHPQPYKPNFPNGGG